jgi:hypothetical protein
LIYRLLVALEELTILGEIIILLYLDISLVSIDLRPLFLDFFPLASNDIKWLHLHTSQRFVRLVLNQRVVLHIRRKLRLEGLSAPVARRLLIIAGQLRVERMFYLGLGALFSSLSFGFFHSFVGNYQFRVSGFRN